MEMVNKTAREAMEKAGMGHEEADAIAAFIPDWSQFATKQDLEKLRHDIMASMTWRMILVVGIPFLFLVLERYLPLPG